MATIHCHRDGCGNYLIFHTGRDEETPKQYADALRDAARKSSYALCGYDGEIPRFLCHEHKPQDEPRDLT